MRSNALPLLLLMTLAACREPEGYVGAVQAPAPSWDGVIAPLLATHCAGCHSDAGGASLRFDDYASTAADAALLLASVESGLMPPPFPGEACTAYTPGPAPPLSDVEREALRRWVAAGAPRGEGIRPDPPPDAGFEGDVTLRVPPWAPPFGEEADRFECLALPALTKAGEGDRFLTGIAPALRGSVPIEGMGVYLAPRGLELSDRPFPCSGDGPLGDIPTAPLLSELTQVAAWGRGGGPVHLPGGVRVPAGEGLILRIHYLRPDTAGAVDASGLSFTTTDAPERELHLAWAQIEDVEIRPNPNLYLSRDRLLPLGQRETLARVWAVLPQVGAVGVGISWEIYHRDGTYDCGVNGRTSHLRQEALVLAAPIPLKGLDHVRLRCNWDNSVNNPRLPSVPPVTFEGGERVNEERCRLGLWVEEGDVALLEGAL